MRYAELYVIGCNVHLDFWEQNYGKIVKDAILEHFIILMILWCKRAYGKK